MCVWIWVLVIGLGIFLRGKLQLSDLGIFPKKIVPAFLYGLVIWCMIQLLTAAALFYIHGKISWGRVMPGYLVATARADEKECIRYFGSAYREYMIRTKMFLPYLF